VTSSAAKGQYWKTRTKKFLEAAGYQVAFLERMLWVPTRHGHIPVKRDQFASDLLAVDRRDVVFVQVRGGATCRSKLAAARAAFAEFAFPAGTQQWIVLWPPRVRQPEVIVVSEGPCGPLARTLAPRRHARARWLPLFHRASREGDRP
jgi:hypothetical protein